MSQPIKDEVTGADAAGRILAAARDLFAERGYEGASIRDIALRAGVSKANIFHHYRSKAALYAAVLEQAHRHFQEQQQILRDANRSLADALGAFTGAHLREMFENPGMVDLCLGEMTRRDCAPDAASAEEFVLRGFLALVDALAERLDDGRPAPRQDARLLALVLLGSSYAYFRLRPALEGRGSRSDPATAVWAESDAYSCALIELLLPGLGLEGGDRMIQERHPCPEST